MTTVELKKEIRKKKMLLLVTTEWYVDRLDNEHHRLLTVKSIVDELLELNARLNNKVAK